MIKLNWGVPHPIPDEVTRERLNEMRMSKALTDMSLSSGLELFPCHRIVVAGASDYIRDILKTVKSLPGASDNDEVVISLDEAHLPFMNNLLDFLYLGELLVEKDHFSGLCKLANKLKIKFLVVGYENVEESQPKNNTGPMKEPIPVPPPTPLRKQKEKVDEGRNKGVMEKMRNNQPLVPRPPLFDTEPFVLGSGKEGAPTSSSNTGTSVTDSDETPKRVPPPPKNPRKIHVPRPHLSEQKKKNVMKSKPFFLLPNKKHKIYDQTRRDFPLNQAKAPEDQQLVSDPYTIPVNPVPGPFSQAQNRGQLNPRDLFNCSSSILMARHLKKKAIKTMLAPPPPPPINETLSESMIQKIAKAKHVPRRKKKVIKRKNGNEEGDIEMEKVAVRPQEEVVGVQGHPPPPKKPKARAKKIVPRPRSPRPKRRAFDSAEKKIKKATAVFGRRSTSILAKIGTNNNCFI